MDSYNFKNEKHKNFAHIIKSGFEIFSLQTGLKLVMRYENSSILVFHKMNNIKKILNIKLPSVLSEKIINYIDYNPIHIRSARIIQTMYKNSNIYRNHRTLKVLEKGVLNLVNLMKNEDEDNKKVIDTPILK